MECIPPKDPGFSGCTEFYQASCLDEEFFIKKKKKKKKEIIYCPGDLDLACLYFRLPT